MNSEHAIAPDELICAEHDELHARILALEEQLRRVTAERDEARGQLELLRGARFASQLESGIEDELGPDVCHACEGEGVLWVHDFRMNCTRCRGTGRV